MKKDPQSPSAAEWKILRTVQSLSPCAARDVVAELEGESGWSASTIKTMLRRLTQKGHLKTKRVGNSFEYRPTRSAHKLLCQAADGLLANAVGGAVGPLLAYMVERSELSSDDLEELRGLLEDKERRTGTPRRKRGKKGEK